MGVVRIDSTTVPLDVVVVSQGYTKLLKNRLIRTNLEPWSACLWKRGRGNQRWLLGEVKYSGRLHVATAQDS